MNRAKRFSKVITVKNQLKENKPWSNRYWQPYLNITYTLGWMDEELQYVQDYLSGNWNSYEEYEKYINTQKKQTKSISM